MKKKIISFVLSSFIVLATSNAFSKTFVVGQKVLAPYGGDMLEAQIISGPNRRGEFKVHYNKTDSSRDKWLDPSKLQDAEEMQKTNSNLKFKVGEVVDTSRDGKIWYEGTIKELKYGKYIIAVDGYQGTSEFSESELRPKAEVNMSGNPNIGDKIEYLSSNGIFKKGILKEIKNGKYIIQTGTYDSVEVDSKDLNSIAKQEEIALQKIQNEYYKTFWSDVSKYSESIKYVVGGYDSNLYGGYSKIDFTPEMIKKISNDLDELHKLCQSKYPTIENPIYLNSVQKTDINSLGGDWRRIAENRKEVIKKAVLIFVKERTEYLLSARVGNNSEHYSALIDGFNTLKKDIEKSLKELKIEDSMKSIGMTFKPDWTEYKKDYDKKLAKFNEDIKSRPPTLEDSEGNKYNVKDSLVESISKKLALSVITNSSVIKSGAATSSWEVHKNEIGIPEYMVKYVAVMLSSKDYRSCIVVYTGVYKQYTGGGTYGSPYAEVLSYKYVRCK